MATAAPSADSWDSRLRPIVAKETTDLKVPGAVGGVWRYAGPLVTGRLTSEKAHRGRMPWAALRQAPFHYGFAMAYYGGAYGHNGQIPGYQNFLGYIPDIEMTLIILTDLFASPDGLAPADEIAKAIIPLLMPPDPAPSHRLQRAPRESARRSGTRESSTSRSRGDRRR